jgi:transcription termination/antitermination protein NusG
LVNVAHENRWYALQTRANHEKKILEKLEAQALTAMLPLYSEVHRWKDRNKKVDTPLFPGYVFVKMDLADRMRAVTISGVVRLVGYGQNPEPIPAPDIELIHSCLQNGTLLRPHAYLPIGCKVRVIAGPLQGVEGVLLRKKGLARLVLSVNLIQSSVALEVNEEEVTPSDPISSISACYSPAVQQA